VHNQISIKDFSLSLPNKICFENFSAEIRFGDRIGIIGRNGCGKSSLLKMIIDANPEVSIAYVPQIIEDFRSVSGGQRFNKSLSLALSENPSMLLLDEPTNHLDLRNRKSLMRMLQSYYGTLIVVTHDKELLRECINTLWHIADGKISIFHGNYDDYMNEILQKRQSLSRQLTHLEREKKSTHQSLMREQERASKKRLSGEKKVVNKRWMNSIRDLKAMKAEKSQGGKLKAIDAKKQRLSEQLSTMRLPEIITPKFYIPHQSVSDRTLVSIMEGAVGYENQIILQNINISLMSHESMAIVGRNGSGKTTLVKAILGDANVERYGSWNAPPPENIGFLDQHYGNLDPEKSPYEIISDSNSFGNRAEVRKHLNDFLFRKNEEVNTLVKNLSGGEKARLSLAKIAANPPQLLILDEITNNIDLETMEHVVRILQEYPGAMIVIAHDESFLDEIEIEKRIELE
jgi:ATPase subunit of ABC transporter with duplicated ATPase domains